jgi:hypothetical protein
MTDAKRIVDNGGNCLSESLFMQVTLTHRIFSYLGDSNTKAAHKSSLKAGVEISEEEWKSLSPKQRFAMSQIQRLRNKLAMSQSQLYSRIDSTHRYLRVMSFVM